MKLPSNFAVHENKARPEDGTVIIRNKDNNQGWVVDPSVKADVDEAIDRLKRGLCWDVRIENKHVGEEISLPSSVNYKELLIKYISHSISSTDIEQGDVLDLRLSSVDFTDEEIKELERLS